MNVTRTKTIEQSIADTEEPEHQLRVGPARSALCHQTGS
jgi:hypothetical protein